MLVQNSLKDWPRNWDWTRCAFDTCLGSGKYQAAIKQDIEEGNRVGVSGTPAFFINGRLISGAQPLEAFVRVIEDELARGAGAQK